MCGLIIPRTGPIVRNIQGGQTRKPIKNQTRTNVTYKISYGCNNEYKICDNYKMQRKENHS